MSKLNKSVTFGGSNYLVSYNCTSQRSITGWTKHFINILEVDGKEIPVFTYSWEDNRPESIIYNTKFAIRKYLESIAVKPSFIDEFVKWDGDLNNWDE